MYAYYRGNYDRPFENVNPFYNDHSTSQLLCTPQKPNYNSFYPHGMAPLQDARGNLKQQFSPDINSLSHKNKYWSSSRDCQRDGNTFSRNASHVPPETKTETHSNVNENNNNNSDNNNGTAKEVSPLCMINLLAKYNKIPHQYILTDEVGPAHKKVFSVKLKLGEEEFNATGASIKKAQHAVATEALLHTRCARPVKKQTNKKPLTNKNLSLAPTVELNTLAMKQGKSVVYRVISNTNINHYAPNYYSKKTPFHYSKSYEPSYFLPQSHSGEVVMEVEVDGKVYSGRGTWMKQAKNACASAAIADLRRLMTLCKSSEVCDKTEGENVTDDKKSESKKSEISQIYEIAHKRKMTVLFSVSKESGPAHMKVYQTTCTCGDLVVEGVGNSKKDSKKDSATKMLVSLKQLPSLPPSSASAANKPFKKPFKKIAKKSNLQKANPDLREGSHPISRLYQIQQAKKQPEPVFKTLKDEFRGKNKKFLVEVSVGDKTCSAWSSKIKTARLLATESMLQLLGYVKPPGNAFVSNEESAVTNDAAQKLTLIDKNIESLAIESMSTCPIEQLQYIALRLAFQVQFRNFPMNTEDGTYVTLVTLTTIPTLHSHGEGASVEESQKDAAKNSIQQLSEFVTHMNILPATTAASNTGVVTGGSVVAASSAGLEHNSNAHLSALVTDASKVSLCGR